MRTNHLYLFLTLLLTVLITGIKEKDVIPDINNYYFGDYTDGLKNYYTAMYHIRWDSSYTHFGGMNYPFGEHVLFTDNQPLFSTILKFIHHHIYPVAPYTVGIFNSLLLLSIVASSLFLFLIFRLLKVNPVLSMFLALGVTFLSPQMGRLGGHYALAYGFIIPMFLYLGLLYFRKSGIRISAIIAVVVILVAFIHAYYLGFAIVILSAGLLVNLFFRKTGFLTSLRDWALQILLPLVLVQLFMVLTDAVPDRPAFPWSPFLGNFWPHGIFLPVGKPLGSWINATAGIPDVPWESVTYIGMVASVFFLLALPLLLLSPLYHRKFTHPFLRQTPSMYFLLFSGVLALIITILFGVLSGYTEIYQLMGPLRQFRAVTRFNWVFYYSINIFAWTWIMHRLTNHKRIWPVSVNAVLILLLFYDAYTNYAVPLHNRNRLDMIEAFHTGETPLPDLEKHDAIIPLPYVHIGSENFVLYPFNGNHSKNLMSVSYVTGMPATGVILSRTSLAQTLFSLTQIKEPVDVPPLFFKELAGKKFLLLISKELPLTLGETLLSNAGKTIHESGEFILKRLDPDQYTRDVKQFIAERTRLHHSAGSSAVFLDYEDPTGKSYFNSGSKVIPAGQNRTVEEIPLNYRKGDTLTFSLWVYLNTDTKALEDIFIDEVDAAGAVHATTRLRIGDNLPVIDGEWGLAEGEVVLAGDSTQWRIYLGQNNLNPTPTYTDGLMIRKKGEAFYREMPAGTMVNNRLYKSGGQKP